MMDAIFIQPWPWYVSGPAVGLFVLAFLYFKGKPLGASSSYQALIEAAQGKGNPGDFSRLKAKADLPVDPRDKAPRWRVWFLGGLLLGGLLSWRLGSQGAGTPGLPGFTDFFGPDPLHAALILFGGGVLIGAGTRMSGGCTSGHAITGISSLQLPSLAATGVFFAVGMALSFLLKAVLA